MSRVNSDNVQKLKSTNSPVATAASTRQQSPVQQKTRISDNNNFATYIKDIMVNMPDTLNTKKDVEYYYKDTLNKFKEDKKAARAKSNNGEQRAMRLKYAKVDNDGNLVVKDKEPLNAYQKFVKDNREKVKNENPKMTEQGLFILLANKWKEYKAQTM
jgi:hypothetical protein